MSKSLGNFFTVRDVLKTLRDPEVLRFFLLEQPLSRTHQLFGGAARAGRRDAAGPVPGAQGHDAQLRSRRESRRPGCSRNFTRPWTTISIRRRRSRCMQGVARELNNAKAPANRGGAHRRGGALAARDGQGARSPAAVAGGLSQARQQGGEREPRGGCMIAPRPAAQRRRLRMHRSRSSSPSAARRGQPRTSASPTVYGSG